MLSLQPLTDPLTKFDGSFMSCNELAKQIPSCQRNVTLAMDDTDKVNVTSAGCFTDSV